MVRGYKILMAIKDKKALNRPSLINAFNSFGVVCLHHKDLTYKAEMPKISE